MENSHKTDSSGLYSPALEESLANTTQTGAYPMPAIPPPSPITMLQIISQKVFSTTPPQITYPDLWLNCTGFFIEEQQQWTMVFPPKIRQLLLNPESQPPHLRHLKMMLPEKSVALYPAHLPEISDVEATCPIVGVLLRWWIEKLQEDYSSMTIPWELQTLIDPVPILPRERNLLPLNQSWTEIQVGSTTNIVNLVSTQYKVNRIQLSCSWNKRTDKKERLSIIKTTANNILAFNHQSKKWEPNQEKMSIEAQAELIKQPAVSMGFKILAWNARGIARTGFKKNIKQLIKDHRPDMIIFTETRVPRQGTLEILESLPFNSSEIVEPIGFTGGISVLWNEELVSFTSLYKDDHAIHGVVQSTLGRAFSLPSEV